MLYEYNLSFIGSHKMKMLCLDLYPGTVQTELFLLLLSPPPSSHSLLLFCLTFTSFASSFFSSLLSFPSPLSLFSFLPPCRFWILNSNLQACILYSSTSIHWATLSVLKRDTLKKSRQWLSFRLFCKSLGFLGLNVCSYYQTNLPMS